MASVFFHWLARAATVFVVNPPQLILASASPRRKQLLREMGVKFRVIASDVDETPRAHCSPRKLAMRLARLKARAVAKRFADAVVIGADTVVTLNGKLYGKPRDYDEAAQMLAELQGKTHCVITGVCVLHLSARKEALFAETTKVTFKKMSAQQIRDYLRLIHPLDKAGAYAAQEHTERLIARTEGSFSNVVGLPTEKLAAVLKSVLPELFGRRSVGGVSVKRRLRLAKRDAAFGKSAASGAK